MRFRSSVLLLLALVLVGNVLYARLRPRPPASFVEGEKETVLPPTAPPSATPAPPARPPAAEEVQPLLDRVFDHTLLVEPPAGAAFVAGDFNGDESTDLAVKVRPRGADVLPTLNGDLVIWGVQDALAPHPETTVRRPERVNLTASDLLLAVVHGVGAEGWRHPDGVQGYLVKNAAGAALAVRPLDALPAASREQVIRPQVGDVIATTRSGASGLVFWTGATYAWTGDTRRSATRRP